MATADRAFYRVITGGLLVRVEGAEGLIRPKIETDLFRLTSGGPIGELVIQKGGARVRGRGRTPPILRYRHAALVGPQARALACVPSGRITRFGKIEMINKPSA